MAVQFVGFRPKQRGRSAEVTRKSHLFGPSGDPIADHPDPIASSARNFILREMRGLGSFSQGRTTNWKCIAIMSLARELLIALKQNLARHFDAEKDQAIYPHRPSAMMTRLNLEKDRHSLPSI